MESDSCSLKLEQQKQQIRTIQKFYSSPIYIFAVSLPKVGLFVARTEIFCSFSDISPNSKAEKEKNYHTKATRNRTLNTKIKKFEFALSTDGDGSERGNRKTFFSTLFFCCVIFVIYIVPLIKKSEKRNNQITNI